MKARIMMLAGKLLSLLRLLLLLRNRQALTSAAQLIVLWVEISLNHLDIVQVTSTHKSSS